MQPGNPLLDDDNLKLIRFLMISTTLLVLASVIALSICNCRREAEKFGWVFTIIGTLSFEFLFFSIWTENDQTNKDYVLELKNNIYVVCLAIALLVALWGIFAGLNWYSHSKLWNLYYYMIYLIIPALVCVNYYFKLPFDGGILAIYCGLALPAIIFFICAESGS